MAEDGCNCSSRENWHFGYVAQPSTANDTMPRVVWGGEGVPDSVLDYTPHWMMFLSSMVAVAWVFITMFVNNNLTSVCGFTLLYWKCAAYETTWVFYWWLGGVEWVLWIMSWLDFELFRIYLGWATYPSHYASLGIYGFILILWIVSFIQSATENLAAVDYGMFAGSIVVPAFTFLLHYFFIDGL